MNQIIPESELIINPDGSIYHLGLRPEQLTPVVLTVGDPERVPLVSRYFDEVVWRVQRREFLAHIGRIGTQKLMVISSGMGTDNVEILMTELDALANIDFATRTVKAQHTSLKIIRIGTSGALQPSVPLDSHLVSDYAFGLDTLMQFYSDGLMTAGEEMLAEQLSAHLRLSFVPYVVKGSEKLKQHIGTGMIEGNTVTCPGFYAPQGRLIRTTPRQVDLVNRLSGFQWEGRQLTNFEMETAGYYAMGRLLGHEVLSTNAIVANRITHQFSRQPAKVVGLLIQKVLAQVSYIST